MKTLIIDNYDSFTYNLADLIAEINQEPPVVVRNDEVEWRALADGGFDNIVISPGPGRPDRAVDFGVSRDAISQADIPLLGVCLGFQGVAMDAGAKLVHAPSLVHGSASRVRHNGNALFAGVPEEFEAGRYHSFMIATPLPNTLEETAWSDDGVLMALTRHDRPQWGVQFHPESILTEYGRRILENFRNLSLRRRSSVPTIPQSRERPRTRTSTQKKAFWREVPRVIDAESVFAKLYGDAPHAFWLDSALVADGLSRWSYLGDAAGPNAAVLTYRCKEQAVDVQTPHGNQIEHGTIFSYLNGCARNRPQTPPPCPFAGGYVGWFGYELQQDCGSHVVRDAETPDALLIHADRFIAIDHRDGKSYLCAIDDGDQHQRAEQWIDDTLARIEDFDAPVDHVAGEAEAPLIFEMSQERERYLANVESCLKSISEGESYQVCLTNELSCEAPIAPFAVYRVMRKINPAPFAAFLKWPGGAVLSASPERFLSADDHGRVETKPIKGTIRRDPDPARDGALVETLRQSTKDRAENAMIVDLLRNDLSRCCEAGSVKVAKLFDVETYETVHQLVSTVVGQLRPDRSFVDLLQAAFPGGSMTGAPKLRTMEIIDGLEQRPRGIYSGALGWFGDDGAADLSIVIRSIIATGGCFRIGVGGGIVAASTPQAEYDEMLLKAQASLRTMVTAVFGRFDENLYRLASMERE